MGERQIITTPSGEELVIVPRAEYEALVRAAGEATEDAADIAAYDARKHDPEGAARLPAELTMAMLKGDNRLKALRKWRGLTQAQLAEATGLGQGYLSALEKDRRTASAKAAEKMAHALAVPAVWLRK
jgi:DNA-binding XRE family transcriptional regulator